MLYLNRLQTRQGTHAGCMAQKIRQRSFTEEGFTEGPVVSVAVEMYTLIKNAVHGM